MNLCCRRKTKKEYVKNGVISAKREMIHNLKDVCLPLVFLDLPPAIRA